MPGAKVAAVAGAVIGVRAAGKQRGRLRVRVDQGAQVFAFLGAEEVMAAIDFKVRGVDPADQGVAVQLCAHRIADLRPSGRSDAAIINHVRHARFLPPWSRRCK